MSTTELVKLVKEYAQAHYDDGGWDVIVECWDDKQIAEHIGKANTLQGALKAFRPIVDTWAERQADADYHRRKSGVNHSLAMDPRVLLY